MNAHRIAFKWVAAFTALAVSLLNQSSANACSVCFGDPDSDLAKGAVAGVIVLGAFVYLMVFSILGVGAFWYVRSRRLAQLPTSEGS